MLLPPSSAPAAFPLETGGLPPAHLGTWREGLVTVLVDSRSCLLVLEEICIPAPVGLFSAL